MKRIIVVYIVSSLKVNVCSTPGHTENVAFGKTSTISSFYTGFSGNHAGFAVNNDTNGSLLPNLTCVHTAETDYTPWWEVDLGRRYYVRNMTVWARTSYEHRMSLTKILVDGKLCHDFGREWTRWRVPNKNQFRVSCNSSLVGRRVTVLKICVYNDSLCSNEDYTINICEFRVLGCSANYWGINCDQSCGHCSGGEDCDKVDGLCTACQPGWVPPMCSQECPDGTYGIQCTEKCSFGCQGPCNKSEGLCDECKPGWTGRKCDREKCYQLSDIAAVGGGLAGVVVLLNAVVVVIVNYRLGRRLRLNHAMEMKGAPPKSTAGTTVENQVSQHAISDLDTTIVQPLNAGGQEIYACTSPVTEDYQYTNLAFNQNQA